MKSTVKKKRPIAKLKLLAIKTTVTERCHSSSGIEKTINLTRLPRQLTINPAPRKPMTKAMPGSMTGSMTNSMTSSKLCEFIYIVEISIETIILVFGLCLLKMIRILI